MDGTGWERICGKSRTYARGIVGEVACVGVCEGEANRNTKGDGPEFHVC